MAGISIVHKSNVSGLVNRLRAAGGKLRQDLEAALAEQALAYSQDLRGPRGGQGITPFDTGRLLTSGNTVQTGLNLTFENDAQEEGRAPYASWAHHAGQPVGDYAAESGKAFDARFGQELLDAWDDAAKGRMEGDTSPTRKPARKPQTFGGA